MGKNCHTALDLPLIWGILHGKKLSFSNGSSPFTFGFPFIDDKLQIIMLDFDIKWINLVFHADPILTEKCAVSCHSHFHLKYVGRGVASHKVYFVREK